MPMTFPNHVTRFYSGIKALSVLDLPNLSIFARVKMVKALQSSSQCKVEFSLRLNVLFYQSNGIITIAESSINSFWSCRDRIAKSVFEIWNCCWTKKSYLHSVKFSLYMKVKRSDLLFCRWFFSYHRWW